MSRCEFSNFQRAQAVSIYPGKNDLPDQSSFGPRKNDPLQSERRQLFSIFAQQECRRTVSDTSATIASRPFSGCFLLRTPKSTEFLRGLEVGWRGQSAGIRLGLFASLSLRQFRHCRGRESGDGPGAAMTATLAPRISESPTIAANGNQDLATATQFRQERLRPVFYFLARDTAYREERRCFAARRAIGFSANFAQGAATRRRVCRAF